MRTIPNEIWDLLINPANCGAKNCYCTCATPYCTSVSTTHDQPSSTCHKSATPQPRHHKELVQNVLPHTSSAAKPAALSGTPPPPQREPCTIGIHGRSAPRSLSCKCSTMGSMCNSHPASNSSMALLCLKNASNVQNCCSSGTQGTTYNWYFNGD